MAARGCHAAGNVTPPRPLLSLGARFSASGYGEPRSDVLRADREAPFDLAPALDRRGRLRGDSREEATRLELEDRAREIITKKDEAVTEAKKVAATKAA